MVEKYIHNLLETDEHGNPPGWYFQDETYDLHGPFESHDDAKKKLVEYMQTQLL